MIESEARSISGEIRTGADKNPAPHEKRLIKAGQGAALFYIAAIFLLAALGHAYFFNLTYVTSLRGFSLVEYLAHALHPENFARDYPGGSYYSSDKSIITNLYVPLKQITGLPSITLMAGGIWLEVLSVIAAGTVLWRSLVAADLENTSSEDRLRKLFVGAWLITVLVAGNVVRPNLSNFGSPFFHGQFYGYADALAFLAIAAYLRGKWAWVALALMVAFAVHPIKATMPTVFIGVSVLVNARTDLHVRSLISGGVVALFAAYWAYFHLQLGGVEGVPGIPDELFIAYTRIQQYHWYPADTGLISFGQDRGLVPFFALMTMALVAALKADLDQRKRRAFLAGYVALASLTALGIYFSIDLGSAFLVKLSLVRASEFMVQLSPFLISAAIYKAWQRKEWLWAGLLVGFLITAMFPNTLPSSFLAYAAAALYVVQSLWSRGGKAGIVLVAAIASTMLLLTLINSWSYPGSSDPLSVSRKALLLVACCYVAFKMPFPRRFGAFKSLATAIVFCMLFSYGAYAWLRSNSANQGDMDLGRSFLEAQLWARDSTKADALFMVDPCQNYGWRDFSERSSIGTPREWFMTGWIYVSDLRAFRWGQEIAETFGLDISARLPKRDMRAEIQITEICEDARPLFYDISRQPLRRMHEKYAIDYFVMEKEPSEVLVTEHSVQPAFSNEHYRIFSAKEFLK